MTRAISYAALLIVASMIVVTGAIGGLLATIFGSDTPAHASNEALSDIPPDYLALYQQAAELCPGLDWTILAAIGKIETDHGRSTLPGVTSGHNGVLGNDGAKGPMQFLQTSFDSVRARHNDVGPNIYQPDHAIPAAALYLCDSGARDGRDLRGAIFAYNHADWYVRDVLHQAEKYRAAEAPRTGATDWEPQQATIPDPTSNGKITPRMHSVLRDIQTRGPSGLGITCVGDRPNNPTSDHPSGRACDVMFDPHDKQSVADGWTLAKRLIRTRRITGIEYLIWQGQYWSAENPQWAVYESKEYGCPNPNNLTGCHYDHIHISVF